MPEPALGRDATDAGRDVIRAFAPYFEAVVHRVIRQTLSKSEADTLVELLSQTEYAASQPCPEDNR